MAIELITGRAGTPHVDSADVGALNAALFGDGAYILDGVTAELVDANNVLVTAGEMLCEGRHVRITGDGETLAIDNGLSAYKRHDIIAAKYLRGEDGIETVTLVVIKGSNSSTAPQDPPMPRQGKVIEGASEAYWPLYRVVIDGLTPQTPIFIAQRQAVYTLGIGTEIPTGADLNDYTKPGMYYTPSSAVTQSLVNAPDFSGHRNFHNGSFLEVRQLSNSVVAVQRLFSSYTGASYSRRLYNGEWTEWYSNQGIDSVASESIGANDTDWSYRKYDNGTAECWCNVNHDGGKTAEAAGSWYRSATFTKSFPFTFTKYPTVMLTAFSASPMAIEQASASVSSTGYRFMSPQNATHTYMQARIYVIGRWK